MHPYSCPKSLYALCLSLHAVHRLAVRCKVVDEGCVTYAAQRAALDGLSRSQAPIQTEALPARSLLALSPASGSPYASSCTAAAGAGAWGSDLHQPWMRALDRDHSHLACPEDSQRTQPEVRQRREEFVTIFGQHTEAQS